MFGPREEYGKIDRRKNLEPENPRIKDKIKLGETLHYDLSFKQ